MGIRGTFLGLLDGDPPRLPLLPDTTRQTARSRREASEPLPGDRLEDL
jgi:hypothetical protein